VLALLKQWQVNQQIRPIDFHFAKFMAQLGADNLMQLAAALTSQQLGEGHICLPLDKIGALFHQHCVSLSLDPQNESEHLQVACIFHDLQQTHALLIKNPCCGEEAPLRLEHGALFMARYAEFEQLIANKFLQPVSVNIAEDSHVYLDLLFEPNYAYLWAAWQQYISTHNEENHAAVIQGLCQKYLDVIDQAVIDWAGVEAVFLQATSHTDLQALNTLITDKDRCDWQKISAALALTSARCVISGGPGTGKTTTVVKLLALLLQGQPTLSIKMVAPTGKAAARLTESITHALTDLTAANIINADIAEIMPTEASTIHRLLGVRNNSAHFRHHQDNPLILDLLLVDEASMVDLPLMAKLLSALPDHARLILLGDKDQLASVEAGAVLGDICSFVTAGYSQQKAQQLAELTGFESLLTTPPQSVAPQLMADQLCLLRKSYRFDQDSGIGHLASAVNRGGLNAGQLAKLCEHYADLNYYAHDDENNSVNAQDFERLVVTGYRPYLAMLPETHQILQSSEQTKEKNVAIKALIQRFNDFKILCATREQAWGVEALNRRCEKILQQVGLLTTLHDNGQTWYAGRPVMITENSYHLNLFNGDIGVCLQGQEGQLRVYFVMADGSIADYQPSRLPSHQTVFAMTVHKSQGSEFSHTLLALPNYALPVVNRELIYTGITRAKKQLTLMADLSLVASAVRKRATRSSRLTERLTRHDH